MTNSQSQSLLVRHLAGVVFVCHRLVRCGPIRSLRLKIIADKALHIPKI
jgi:hypothetical protein